MKFLKSLITLGCIALQTVACATVPTQELGPKSVLQIQEGNYRGTGNVGYCDDIATVTWDGQMVVIGANLVFLNVNGPAFQEKNEYSKDECTFTTLTQAQDNQLLQTETEVCKGYQTTNVSKLIVQGTTIIFTKQTTEATNPNKRPPVNATCYFKRVR